MSPLSTIRLTASFKELLIGTDFTMYSPNKYGGVRRHVHLYSDGL